MHENSGEWVEWSEQWRAYRPIGVPTQVVSDLCGRRLSTTLRQLIDRACQTAAPQSRPLKNPETVEDDAKQVCCHRLDAPSFAEAWRRQLCVIQFINEICNPAAFFSDRRKYKLTIHSH